MGPLHYIAAISFATLAVFALTCSADDHEYRLVEYLMRDYDPRIRPSRNASEALNVTFGMALAQIIDVDEKNQIITTNCWLNQAWIDYKLVWDPKEFGGIKVVRLPWDAIWRPDVLLYNNADVSSYSNMISTNMIVSNDGNVTWLSMIIFKSSCSIDVKYFPFDEQMCHMLFASWTYDGFQINLLKVGDDGDVSNYIPNSEWALVKLHAVRNVEYYSCCAEPYPDVTYSIQMRRKPLFYVFNMILPCFIITFVALLGFYMPSDSGEKVTMGITTLLSMTVFLMLVAESMPPTSDVLPLIGLYYGITIGIVSLATGCTVLTLNIHHKGVHGSEVPYLVRKVCLGFIAKILCMKTDPAESNTKETEFHPVVDTKASVNNSSYIRLKPAHAPAAGATSATARTPSVVTHLHNSYYPINYPESPHIRVPADYLRNTVERQQRHSAATAGQNGGLSPSITSRIRQTGTGNASVPTPQSSGSHLLPAGEGPFEKQFIKTLQKVYQTIERNEMRLADQDRRDIIKNDWQQVGLVVDRCLLGLFVILTLTITITLMTTPPQGWVFFLGQSKPGVGET